MLCHCCGPFLEILECTTVGKKKKKTCYSRSEEQNWQYFERNRKRLPKLSGSGLAWLKHPDFTVRLDETESETLATLQHLRLNVTHWLLTKTSIVLLIRRVRSRAKRKELESPSLVSRLARLTQKALWKACLIAGTAGEQRQDNLAQSWWNAGPLCSCWLELLAAGPN